MAKFNDFRRRVVYTCQDVNDFLTAYSEGELEEGERRRFERHVARCASCGTYLDQYRRTLELVKGAGGEAEHPPEELVRYTLAFLREHLGEGDESRG